MDPSVQDVFLKSVRQLTYALLHWDWPRALNPSTKINKELNSGISIFVAQSGLAEINLESSNTILLEPGEVFLYQGKSAAQYNSKNDCQVLRYFLDDGFLIVSEEVCRNEFFYQDSKNILISGNEHFLSRWQKLSKLSVDDFLSRHLALCEVKLLFNELYQFLNSEDSSKVSRDQSATRHYQNILSYVKQNFYYPISRNTIAEHFSLSPTYVSEVFKSNHNTPFKDYLNSLRLEHACELLRHPLLKVADIAQLCGFNSRDNFIYAFRQKFSCSPLKMKKQLQEMADVEILTLKECYGIYNSEPVLLKEIEDLNWESLPRGRFPFMNFQSIIFNKSEKSFRVYDCYNGEEHKTTNLIESGQRLVLSVQAGETVLLRNEETGESQYFQVNEQPAIVVIP